jgi:hypothetical protein
VGRAVTENRRREARAGQHREHGRKGLTLGVDRELEVAAPDTQAQMPA